MTTHPKGHDCPDGQKWDSKKGQCIDKETVDKNDYPESRNRSNRNLDFTVKKKRGENN